MSIAHTGHPGEQTGFVAQARRRLVRFGLRYFRLLSWRRLSLTFAICVLVSTQFLFQPLLYEAFLAEQLVRGWLDYATECVLIGGSICLCLTAAELAAVGRSRVVATAIVIVAILAGVFIGTLLLIPFYELSTDAFVTPAFWGDATYWIAIGGGVVTIYLLNNRAAEAAAKLHDAQVDRIALAKQMLEAQLQVMRAQIEPHFLFNTLANVKRLCQTDVSGGLVMLENLVRYLRAALPRMRQEQTTLGQEADLVQAYLAVLQIRMGARLAYAIDVPRAIRDRPFPPMMLLTLAENAIKHGLNPAPDGGRIAISASSGDGAIELRVADTGVGFGNAATGGSGVGLANTRARLSALYGNEASLALEVNIPSGVIALIRVPDAPPTGSMSPEVA